MASGLLEKQATVEDVIREVSKFKAVLTDAVEEGIESAVKTMKHGRDAAEDALYEARRAVKQRPFQSMGVVFAAGIFAGSLVGWACTRRR